MKEKLPLAEGISVVAFDPGKTTGIFFLNRCWFDDTMLLNVDQMVELAIHAADKAYRTLFSADVWIVESFQLYKHKGTMTRDALIPMEVIGMLKVAAKRLGIPQIVFQSASEAKGLVDDERLALYGWNLPTPHERDAARHAVYYLSKKHQEEMKNAEKEKSTR